MSAYQADMFYVSLSGELLPLGKVEATALATLCSSDCTSLSRFTPVDLVGFFQSWIFLQQRDVCFSREAVGANYAFVLWKQRFLACHLWMYGLKVPVQPASRGASQHECNLLTLCAMGLFMQFWFLWERNSWLWVWTVTSEGIKKMRTNKLCFSRVLCGFICKLCSCRFPIHSVNSASVVYHTCQWSVFVFPSNVFPPDASVDVVLLYALCCNNRLPSLKTFS